jgi:hypothetical protein
MWWAHDYPTKCSLIISTMPSPPNGLPNYRVLTGPDDEEFCRRVSEALALGFGLHGSPGVTFDGQRVIVAQALMWPAEPDQPGEASRGGP